MGRPCLNGGRIEKDIANIAKEFSIWQARVDNPKRCARCKTIYWATERTRLKRAEIESNTTVKSTPGADRGANGRYIAR